MYIILTNKIKSYYSYHFKITSTTNGGHAQEETKYSRDMLIVSKIAVRFVMNVPSASPLNGGDGTIPTRHKVQIIARLHPRVPMNIQKKERVTQQHCILRVIQYGRFKCAAINWKIN